MVIGIPQALAYHYFYPLWRTFFTELGIEIKTSGLTDRCVLDLGLRIAPSEACLPLKCYLGHILSLVKNVDTIFVPGLACLKKNPQTKLGCPKFIGLPDMCRALIPEARFITLDIDLRRQEEVDSFRNMAKKLGRNSSQGKDAYQRGLEHGCGASSITNEIMELEIRGNSNIPLLRIILDEHTGEAGMITRLESFVDMIRLKKRERGKGVKGEGS